METLKPSELDWFEYLGIIFVLVVSVATIIWFRSSSDIVKNSALTERMPLIPVAISLVASSTSGMSMLAKPTEAYKHGIEFFVMNTTFSLIIVVLSDVVFMPVLFKLKADSIYEYFERRFGRGVRMLTSASFIISKVGGSAIVALPPSIVLSHFSGLRVSVLTCILLIVTTLYTSVGGYKGVVWTDVFQGIIMFGTTAVLCFISMKEVGGPSEVLRITRESGRLKLPDMPIDPTARLPIWTYLCCLSGLSTACLNQSMYQRYKSLQNKKDLTLSLCVQFLGCTLFTFISFIMGFSVYAYYYGCDPKSAGLVNSYTNVIVYWLDDVGQRFKGFRGMYIAGITCASISTISTHINSCAGLISREWLPTAVTLTQRTIKLSSACVGLAAIILTASFGESTGSLLELSYYLSVMDGVVSAFFILGVLVVPANSKATLISGIIGGVLNSIIVAGSYMFASKGLLPTHPVSSMRTDECPNNLTIAEPTPMSLTGSVFYLFRLSPFTIGPLICVSVVIGGYIGSALFREEKDYNLDPDLYSPYALKLFPEGLICSSRKERTENETSIPAKAQLLEKTLRHPTANEGYN